MKGLKKIASNYKEKKSQLEWENEFLKYEIEKLEEELSKKKDELKEDDKNRELLNSLYSQGVIDEDGNILT